MVSLAIFIALASWICGVSAQIPVSDVQPLYSNISMGGMWEQFPGCALGCMSSEFDLNMCDPADPECYCPLPFTETTVGNCLNWFCPVQDYLAGLRLYKETCNTPIRNISHSVYKAVITSATIALVAVTLRFITRLPPMSVVWGADDWLVVVVVPIAVAYFACILLTLKYGFGQDIFMLPTANVPIALKYYYFTTLGYAILAFLTKITVLTFYLRIFPHGRFQHTTYLLIGLCSIMLLSMFLAFLLECLPIKFLWEQWSGTMTKADPEVVCGVDPANRNLAFGLINVVLDGIIVIVPIPKVAKLKLKWRRKIAVLFVFCIGFLITGVAIARLVNVFHDGYTVNITWDHTTVLKWSALEVFLSIFVVCVPAIHALFKCILGIWISSDETSNSSKPSHGSSSRGFTSTKSELAYENLELGDSSK